MSSTAFFETVENQITNSRALLELLAKERQRLDDGSVPIQEIHAWQQQKQKLIAVIVTQVQSLRNHFQDNTDDQTAKRQRELMKQVSDLLAQLLAAEQDNENRFRQLMVQPGQATIRNAQSRTAARLQGALRR